MTAEAELLSVSSRVGRLLDSMSGQRTIAATNVGSGHKALGDDWLLPGTGIALTVCGGMELLAGFAMESVAGFRWNIQLMH